MKFRKKSNDSFPHFINLNTRACKACWKCLETCPNHVFEKIDFPWHRHVKIKHPENCTGCLKCVEVCEHGALAKPVN